MACSFFVNAMQVNFESVLVMEHIGMAKMFKSLEDTGRFLEASYSVYEGAVTECFANAKVIVAKEGCTVGNPEVNLETTVVVETQADNTTNTVRLKSVWAVKLKQRTRV
ncbi:leucine-rich repeat family protein [Dorcoceras hygrometricum]|uniref:Leucine-rich repeat family protein n=1 Tax=Dorcoceras hygrometricum TaxID=472368 RepID=A0A2Z7D8I7_9LAMI|nr:leucine-rich repeat family protein [Dorcoceras hygrometricum]